MGLKSLLQAFGSNPKPQPTGTRIKVAVLGAGRMGTYHAKNLVKQPLAELIGIFDADPKRAQALAKGARTSVISDISHLFGAVEAVVIATPTATHASLGTQLLGAGIHCLIEKPIASTLPEAETLLSAARAKNLILQIGHIERFNPAVLEAARHIQSPQFIEVNRLGPYDPRVADIGVVLDLMIHDLDMVLFLVGEPVTRVEAFGAKVLSNHEDIAKVRLHFANGCIADLSASRISLKKYRKIRIFQKDSYLSLDYAGPKLEIYRKKKATVKSLLDVQRLVPKLSQKDPLTLELEHFLNCVRDRRSPLVSGEHGRDALALAQNVLANLKIHA